MWARLILVAILVSSVSANRFDVNTCGSQKTCVLNPPGCNSIDNCLNGMSFTPLLETGELQIELFGKVNKTDNAYTAFAFTEVCGEKCMANTKVLECSNFGDGPRVRLSYNNDVPANTRIPNADKVGETLLSKTKAVVNNGVIFCSVEQKVVDIQRFLPGQNIDKYFNFDKTKMYTVIMASGPTSSTGLLQHYSGYAFLSHQYYNLFGVPVPNNTPVPPNPVKTTTTVVPPTTTVTTLPPSTTVAPKKGGAEMFVSTLITAVLVRVVYTM